MNKLFGREIIVWLSGIVLEIALLSTFIGWLVIEKPYERVHRVTTDFNRLVEVQKYDKAEELLLNELNIQPITPSVAKQLITLLFFFHNNHNMLIAYRNFLYSLPEYEIIYQHIHDLLLTAPTNLTIEKRNKFLQSLSQIPAVNQNFLKKYFLNADFDHLMQKSKVMTDE